PPDRREASLAERPRRKPCYCPQVVAASRCAQREARGQGHTGLWSGQLRTKIAGGPERSCESKFPPGERQRESVRRLSLMQSMPAQTQLRRLPLRERSFPPAVAG